MFKQLQTGDFNKEVDSVLESILKIIENNSSNDSVDMILSLEESPTRNMSEQTLENLYSFENLKTLKSKIQERKFSKSSIAISKIPSCSGNENLSKESKACQLNV